MFIDFIARCIFAQHHFNGVLPCLLACLLACLLVLLHTFNITFLSINWHDYTILKPLLLFLNNTVYHVRFQWDERYEPGKSLGKHILQRSLTGLMRDVSNGKA
jgi:hypothetical protein